MRLFSTEQVSKYHPDKFADQISDAVLDACLQQNKNSRVACETMVKGNTVILAGEITTSGHIDYPTIACCVGKKLGYMVGNVLTFIETQSPEIANGVSAKQELGAGDQGMMYGYASTETESMLPFGFDLANRIIAAIESDVAANPETVFQGDAKCQVTVDLDEKPDIRSVKKVLVSVCQKEDYDFTFAVNEVKRILKSLDIENQDGLDVIINPAGKWTIGGPLADCGLTGRKIVCDQYGGYCPVGGGAFSGKDPSKVDRSGAYMARKIAVDLLGRFELKWCEVQIAYAIGLSEPMSVFVKCDKQAFTTQLIQTVRNEYDLSPAGIIKNLDLLNPKKISYEKLAEGCHFRK